MTRVELIFWDGVKRHGTKGDARAVLDEWALHCGNSMTATIDREREIFVYLGFACRFVNVRPVKRPMLDVAARFKEIH